MFVFLSAILTNNFVVVLDAGFTSTKLNVYSFNGKIISSSYTKFYHPGLHELDLDEIGNVLKKVLQEAKRYVEENSGAVDKTRLAFVATEGLRSLQPSFVSKILECVCVLVQKSGFLSGKSSVIIMDGVFEGLYAYEALVYLLLLNDRNNEMVKKLGEGASKGEVRSKSRPNAGTGKIGAVIEEKPIDIFNDFMVVDSIKSQDLVGSKETSATREPKIIKTGDKSRKAQKEKTIRVEKPEKFSLGIIEMGGGSVQIAFSTVVKNKYQMFVHSFHELGLIKGQEMLASINFHDRCTSFAPSCILDFKNIFKLNEFSHIAPINSVKKFFLLSFFYDRLVEFRAPIKKFLDIITLYEKRCGKQSSFCTDVKYMIFVLKGIGLKEETDVDIKRYVGEKNLNWGLAKALEML